MPELFLHLQGPAAAAPGDTFALGAPGVIDWIGLGIASLFMLLGFMRGLWWQIVRLFGLIGAAALARMFSGPWGARLQESSDLSGSIAVGVVWVGLFLGGVVLTALIGSLGKRGLEAIQLGLQDRLGGLVAGLVTGLVLHLAWMVVLAHLGPQPWTANQFDQTYSRVLLQSVTTRYPVLTAQETPGSDGLFFWLGTEPDGQAGHVR